jgi:uncharacterized Zn-binding protein involved in type VI secretion/phage baseplate assembly protein gpV
MSERAENGIVVGVVCDLNDADNLGRVRVKYPHLGGQVSDWARLATPMAGGGRGVFFRPEKDDEVLVGFEHGDPRRPYILGSLWSQVDKPPKDDGQKTQNNWRFIQSRSGHIVKLDDTAGKEKIEIVDKDSKRRIVIDSANRKIQILCDSAAGDIEIKAPQSDVKIEAATITVKATTSLTLESEGDRIVALDVHIILPAAQPAPAVPVPHPFSGVIDGALSRDVKIQGMAAATVNSTATNTPPHVPIGGTFVNPPKNQGRIIRGSARVTNNGQPAARAGDTALTCNDPVDLPSGTVVAQSTVFIGD